MALPADVHEQIAAREARLRIVPAGETPPPKAVREQVQRWQEHVHVAAEAIRWADTTIEQIAGMPGSPDDDRLLVLVRETRARAFELLRQLNPDQAWFWTEEWQAGEREVDRDAAAGRVTTCATLEEFDAVLDALDAQRTDAG